MKKIAVFGSEAFTLGFQLAGIRDVYEAKGDTLDQIHKIKENKDIGIVIVEEDVLQNLDSHDRSEIEDDVSPVFIPLSTNAESGNLRKMIVKSIGVDLWKEE